MDTKVRLLFCAILAVAHSKSVILGQVFDQSGVVRMVDQKVVERTAIPFIKEIDYVSFFTPGKIIKGIAMKDLENGLAEPSVTGGGLGYNYANIKVEGEMGSGYNFVLEVYA